MQSSFRLALALVSTLSFAVAFAQSGSIVVDSKSNIFGAGSANPTPQPGGGGGGIGAALVNLDPGTGRILRMNATGTWGWNGGQNNGADGGNFANLTSINSVDGISGYTGPLSGFLVAVFLDASSPDGQTAPGTFSYGSASDYSLTTYAPLLRQVFFVGDGLTGDGTGDFQDFLVPDGATRLYYGVADASGFFGNAGWYDDNVGSVTVEYGVVPEPATMLLLAGGMALAARRRKK